MNEEQTHYAALCKREGWELVGDDGSTESGRDNGQMRVWIDSLEKEVSVKHPYAIHLMIYRDCADVETRVKSMHRIHDLLWPDHAKTWHKWTERRFEAHCEGWSPIVMASGASGGKSIDAAKIALIFWLSDPRSNACIVASTTLESLESRIWGYVAKFFAGASVGLPGVFMRSKPPKILYPKQADKIHGMFAVAIPIGSDERVLSTVIGRHPDKRLMVVLDEATDMNPGIAKTVANLEEGVEFFQLWAIGNSNSKNDLHGALATPKLGWQSVDPSRDYVWATQHPKGICLYFNPYDSPAITEPDYEKRLELGKFLMTEEKLRQKVETYGESSDAFLRFTMGFWGSQSIDRTTITEPFLTENQVDKSAEWSGFYPLQVVAGLDPAFQVGGTGCLLRLGIMGQTTGGDVVIDFRGDELIFRLDIQLSDRKSGEKQLAEQVLAVLREYGCSLGSMALDATGVGRSLGELLFLMDGSREHPFKIVSVPHFATNSKKKGTIDPFITVTSPSELWMNFRSFIQHKQIRGIDTITRAQLIHRLLILTKANKLQLEPKMEYRRRMASIKPSMAHSPDESDAMMLAVAAATLRFGFQPGLKRSLPKEGTSLIMVAKEQAYRHQKNIAAAQEVEERGRPPIVPNFSADMEDLARTHPRRD